MNSNLSKFGKLGTAYLGVCLGLFGTAAYGQGTDLAELETITTTGTRLTGAGAEGSLSVSAYNFDELSSQGYSDFGDLLRKKLPQFGGGIGTINDSYGNGGSGQATISLRNLPLSRALFLIDGRRTNLDVNMIPNIAIQQIEVLNDGASPIYGSDAVAGVANVILKKNFEGLTANARYADTTETNIGERRFGAILGRSFEKTNFTIAFEWSKANDQLSPDRPNSLPSGDMVSGTSNPGLFTPVASAAMVAAADANGNVLVPLRWFVNPQVTSGLTSRTGVPASFNPIAFVEASKSLTTSQRNALRDAREAELNAAMGASSPVQYGPNAVLLPGVNPGMPYGYYTMAYRPHRRVKLYGNVTHQLTENIEVFAEVIHATNTSTNFLAPSPLGGVGLPGNNYYMKSIFPEASAAGVNYRYSYRPLELGPRVTTNDFSDTRIVLGAKGDISGWKYEVGYMNDSWELDQLQSGGVLAGEYIAALNESSNANAAWNPFGYTPLFGTSSPVNSDELVASFAGAAGSLYTYDIEQLDATVSTELIDLPAGAMEIAFGIEYREEEDTGTPDEALINGDVFPFNGEPAYATSRDITSYYAEVNIPIIESVSVGLAGRYEDYSDVGDTGIKPRVSVRWEPIENELTIRGSWAQGFVAPSIYTLLPVEYQSFTELYNPITETRTQAEDGTLFVGNPNLKPSESDSYLIGFVYSPAAVDGLSFGMNYYKIEETGIPFTSDQYIVNEWAAAGGPDNANNPFGPNAVPSAQNPLGSQVEIIPSSGEFLQVRNVGPINSGVRDTDGIDLFASYEIGTDVGDFTIGASFTKVLSFEQEDFPGAGLIDYLGYYWGSGAALGNYGFPKWKGSVTLDWDYEAIKASIGYNYVDGYKEVENANYKIEAYATFDVRVAYTLPWGEVDIVAGVNNVFDEPPPFVVTSFENGFDRAVADIRGRMFFVELTKKF